MVSLLLLFMEMKPLHPAFLKGLWEYGICDAEWASWSPIHNSTNINLTISLQHHVFHTSSIISQYRIWRKLLSLAKYFPQDLLMLVPSTLECLLRYPTDPDVRNRGEWVVCLSVSCKASGLWLSCWSEKWNLDQLSPLEIFPSMYKPKITELKLWFYAIKVSSTACFIFCLSFVEALNLICVYISKEFPQKPQTLI